MITYLEQIETAAQAVNLSALQAFRLSDVPTSTYYRTKNGGDLRLKTAQKVLDAIQIYALQHITINQS